MKTRVGVIVLLVAVSVLGPTFQWSEAGGGRPSHRDVVLYELNEQAQLIFDAVDPQKPPRRVASSGLQGKARLGTPVCTVELMAHAESFFRTRNRSVKDASRCTVVAFGNSDLDTATFQGTIDGKLYVVVNSVATNLTDAPELVVMEGTFEGTIAVKDATTIKLTTGTLFGDKPPTWCPRPAGCTFTGTFRQPFTIHHIAVYQKEGHLVPVLSDERALGDPTVRLEITFD
jgi:hypothetical protein